VMSSSEIKRKKRKSFFFVLLISDVRDIVGVSNVTNIKAWTSVAELRHP
jgi:hypothetical protein